MSMTWPDRSSTVTATAAANAFAAAVPNNRFLWACADGQVPATAAGLSTYNYWEQHVAGMYVADQRTPNAVDPDPAPDNVRQWIAAFDLIPWFQLKILISNQLTWVAVAAGTVLYGGNVQSIAMPRATEQFYAPASPGLPAPIALGLAPGVLGQSTAGSPRTQYDLDGYTQQLMDLLTRVHLLQVGGTTAAWTPAGGGTIRADQGIASQPGAPVDFVITALKQDANTVWQACMTEFPEALNVVADAPYPEIPLGAYVGSVSPMGPTSTPGPNGTTVIASPGSVGDIDTSAVALAPVSTALNPNAVLRTSFVTPATTPTEAAAIVAAPNVPAFPVVTGGNGSSVSTVSTPTLSTQVATPTPTPTPTTTRDASGGINWQTAGILATIVAALAVAWSVWGKN